MVNYVNNVPPLSISQSKTPNDQLCRETTEFRKNNETDMSILFHLSSSLFLDNSIAKNNLKTKLRKIVKYPLISRVGLCITNFFLLTLYLCLSQCV